MVVSDKMERAVDDQVRRVIGERNALLFRLARTGFAREDDVAEQDLAIIAVRQTFEKLVMHLRKGKDVGRLVLAPELGRESCRARVGQYVWISVVCDSLQNKLD